MSESQINYLFTLKNAHLSSNGYNFWMQLNIAMKFAGYVAWIFLCKCCKFGEKSYYNSRDIEFFLGDYFFGAPCRRFGRQSCNFWYSIVVAIIWLIFYRAHHRKSRICSWNFDAICQSSRDVFISGFGGHIDISGCRSLLYSHLYMLLYLRFVVRILTVPHIVSEICISGFGIHFRSPRYTYKI